MTEEWSLLGLLPALLLIVGMTWLMRAGSEKSHNTGKATDVGPRDQD